MPEVYKNKGMVDVRLNRIRDLIGYYESIIYDLKLERMKIQNTSPNKKGEYHVEEVTDEERNRGYITKGQEID